MKTLNDIFLIVASFMRGIMGNLGFPAILVDLLMGLTSFIAIAVLVTVNIIVILWVDRRVASFFQERLGPNRVGPFGLLQSVNDAAKLIGKESIMPAAVDKKVYKLAPILIFTVTIILYGLLPYGRGLSPINLSAGLLFFVAISSTSTIAILMAGWGSNNKYSLLGGMRTVAQVISYEIPLAFIIVLVSALAELSRSPFDMTEAEQELIAGYHTEYSGMRFALFFMAEYANLFSVAALGATLFLGGWEGPILPGYAWFIGKTWAMVFVILWLRWTFPRARVERMMQFNWKFLIPLSILNIFLTGIGIKLFQYFTAAGR